MNSSRKHVSSWTISIADLLLLQWHIECYILYVFAVLMQINLNMLYQADQGVGTVCWQAFIEI